MEAQNQEQTINYIENLMQVSQNVKSSAGTRRKGLCIESEGQDNLDSEILKVAIVNIGEEIQRKNSTKVTEEDENNEEHGDGSLSDSPDEDNDENAIKL
ncbi:UNKNOWN [Stylonychia lemnae]|uniref:Uncharacterized protein n=1 Tax=Stylonychia lemnae TaxID=5949 RepID=A0A078B109_STYLE|nr:UNKNOWN [Stylonychia lemnae]|eukprot:CDW86773.1 UNKNOWN [Stylonychia lemnae]